MTLKRSLLLPRETGGAGTDRRAVLRVHSVCWAAPRSGGSKSHWCPG